MKYRMAVVHDMLKKTPLNDIMGYLMDLNDMKRITAITGYGHSDPQRMMFS